MYYKIKTLSEQGVEITLHYFNYKKDRDIDKLKPLCSKIYVYKRSMGIRGFSINQPYIVSSRINHDLVNNINDDEHPILLEGIHCTGVLPYINRGRSVFVRMHNDEEKYYLNLFISESSLYKKFYYGIEALMLRHYQKKLPDECTYVCMSKKDMNTLETKYRLKKLQFIPCFIPWQQLSILKGKGDYCLYHGNLAVAENLKAARWLIENIFSVMDIRLIVAGRGASKLSETTKQIKNISYIDAPTDDQLNALIQNAHINLVPSFNSTGVKLKLLHALLKGRFCIANSAAIDGSGINNSVHVAETPDEYVSLISSLMQKEYTTQNIDERNYVLSLYNNHLNAAKLIDLL